MTNTNQTNSIFNRTGTTFSQYDETSFEKNLESEMNLFQDSFESHLQDSLNKRISFGNEKKFYYFKNDNNSSFETNIQTNRGGSKQRQGPNSSKQIKRALLISTEQISKEGSDLNKVFKNTIASEINKINQQEQINKTTNQKNKIKNKNKNTGQVNGLEFDERLKITKNLLKVLENNSLSQKISQVLFRQLKSEIPQLLKNSCQQNIIKIMNQTIPLVFQQIQKRLNTELNNKFSLSMEMNNQNNINLKEIEDTISPFLDKRINIINESIKKTKKMLQIQIATSIQEKKPLIIQKLKNEI
ncbi:hypothetical protein M0813_25388 [Anaeramoeba flamelloides]|uniref:Uncharacterized protein n=1 Tax=Anaeramoeba flamelloides TaxID=1746091 RepID=A0ABQ8Y337_9EUKA|nr:hypothetical protein M0813_25388 [Anaeramoeba flamelloides]